MKDSNMAVPIETLLAERDWVRWLARTLVADPNGADDLEQQTWLAAIERPPAHAASVRGWLATVLRRAASKGRRSTVRGAQRELKAARPEGERSTVDIVAEAEQHDRVVRAVLDLEEPYRTTVLLRFFESLPPRDIAERTNVPVETARSRVQRGVALLRERFDRDHQGDRKAWMAAFLPLTTPRPSDAGPAAQAAAAAGSWKLIAVGCALVAAIGGATFGFARSSSERRSDSTWASGNSESATGPASDSELAAPGRPPSAAAPDTGVNAGPKRAPAPAGNLTGRVLRDGPAGAPVPGARVVALRRSVQRTDPDAFETTSDADGRFSFVELPAGEVMVYADAPGFTTEGLVDVSFEGYNPLATTVTSKETVAIDVVLVPAAVAAGHVFDPDGRPLVEVTVLARIPEPTPSVRAEQRVPLPPWKATTADDGSFRFETLPAGGVYDFDALPDGLHAGWLDGVTVPGPTARSIEIRIPASRWIDVQVLDGANDTPVAGASVSASAIDADPTHVRRCHCEALLADANGRVRVGPFPLVDVEVRASDYAKSLKPVATAKQRVARDETATIVRIDRTVVATVLEAQARLDAKFLHLHVVGPDGAPIPSARATTYRWSGRGGGTFGVGAVRDGFANCGYSQPWSEYVEVYDARDADGNSLMLGALRVALEKDKTEVAVRLEPEKTISGRVLSPSGIPLPGVLVTARPDWNPTAASPLDRIVHATARTDSVGAFRLGGLADTKYRLSLRLPKELSSDTPTVVAAGAIGVTLTPRDGVRPSITIVDSHGKPVSDVLVGLMLAGAEGMDPRDRRRFESYVEASATALTDVRGVARLGPLDPASRFVLTIDPPKSRPDLKEEVRDGWLPQDGTITLGIGRVVRGRVRDASGKPLEDIEVLCTTRRGGGSSHRVAADGSFVVRTELAGEIILVPHFAELGASGREPQGVVVSEGTDDVDLLLDAGLTLLVEFESLPPGTSGWLTLEPIAANERSRIHPMRDRSLLDRGAMRFRGLLPDRTYALMWRVPTDRDVVIREGIRSDLGTLAVKR